MNICFLTKTISGVTIQRLQSAYGLTSKNSAETLAISQKKQSSFLAYLRFFLYLYTYERASYGHVKGTAKHGRRDAVDA